MISEGNINPRIVKRFATAPITSWQEMADFAATMFTRESCLGIEHVGLNLPDQDALSAEGQKLIETLPSIRADSMSDSGGLYIGAQFLATTTIPYPGITLVDAMRPLAMAASAGHALIILGAGLRRLNDPALQDQYRPDLTYQAATVLKTLVSPDIRTEMVTGYLDTQRLVRPEARQFFTADLRSHIGDHVVAVDIAGGEVRPN